MALARPFELVASLNFLLFENINPISFSLDFVIQHILINLQTIIWAFPFQQFEYKMRFATDCMMGKIEPASNCVMEKNRRIY